MGAIYLTARFHPFGRRTPAGASLATNEDVRRYLLEAAAIGVVPFQAFGAHGATTAGSASRWARSGSRTSRPPFRGSRRPSAR